MDEAYVGTDVGAKPGVVVTKFDERGKQYFLVTAKIYPMQQRKKQKQTHQL